MVTTDLTTENLGLLVDLCNGQHTFKEGYLTLTKASRVTSEETYLTILWYANYELLGVYEFRDVVLDFIYNKKLRAMPLYINEHADWNQVLKSTEGIDLNRLNCFPVLAKWRLQIGC